MVKKITIWKTNGRHNHIEDEWIEGNVPMPKFHNQKSWLHKEWDKKYGYLVDNRVFIPNQSTI